MNLNSFNKVTQLDIPSPKAEELGLLKKASADKDKEVQTCADFYLQTVVGRLIADSSRGNCHVVVA